MKSMRRSPQGGEACDINISPLIDMVFILLIFFIVTTVFVEERGLRTETPEPGPPTDADEMITIRITASGRILIGDRETTRSGLAAELKASRREGNPERPRATIEVEPNARIDDVARVMDACRDVAFDSVSLRQIEER